MSDIGDGVMELLPRVRREENVERRREIHVRTDGDESVGSGYALREYDPAAWAEILGDDPAWPTGADPGKCLALYVDICEDHGWRLDSTWRDEAGELHAKLSKPE